MAMAKMAMASDEITSETIGNVMGVERCICEHCDRSMMRAVKSGDTKEVSKIASKKGWTCIDACVNKDNGDTPLIAALRAEDTRMALFLFRNGADQFNKNNEGVTALELSKGPLREILYMDIHKPEPDIAQST